MCVLNIDLNPSALLLHNVKTIVHTYVVFTVLSHNGYKMFHLISVAFLVYKFIKLCLFGILFLSIPMYSKYSKFFQLFQFNVWIKFFVDTDSNFLLNSSRPLGITMVLNPFRTLVL